MEITFGLCTLGVSFWHFKNNKTLLLGLYGVSGITAAVLYVAEIATLAVCFYQHEASASELSIEFNSISLSMVLVPVFALLAFGSYIKKQLKKQLKPEALAIFVLSLFPV